MFKIKLIGRQIKLLSFQLSRSDIHTTVNNLLKRTGFKAPSEKCEANPQIKRIIKDAGFSLFEGYATFQTKCPICPTRSHNENRVHINKTTGFFFCSSCQKSATWDEISIFFDSGNEDKTNSHSISVREKIVHRISKSVSYELKYQEKDLVLIAEQHKDLLKDSWAFSFISPLCQVGAKLNRESGDIFIPLKNHGRVVGEKVCNVNSINYEETLPRDKCNGLIKLNLSSKDSKRAILVLTVKDLLVIGINKTEQLAVICLPHGLKLLSQEILPELEAFQELIFWFDFDVAGWDSAINFAKKLGERRCLFIRPLKDQQTPYTALVNGANLKHILKAAQPVIHESITTFASLKEDIFSELQNIEKVNGVKWTRYRSLNKILKGHRRGELTILTGPTGSGKTTFMSEYSLDLAMQGVTTLWGSFEIRNIRLASTLLRQLAGYSLNEKLNEFEDWCSKMEKLPIYFTTFHGQQSLKVVMDAIDHAQYVYDIHHIIIDNVQFMLGAGCGLKSNDKFWEQDNIVSAFRKFATKKNVHVTLVMHPRKERENEELTTSSIFGSAKASQEADNVLIIQDKRLNFIKGKKILQVVKNRYSGDLGIMPLNFNKEALSYAEKESKKT